MSDFWLDFTDWALASTSMFNTIVLFWLGLTVLLNARNRSWGTTLAGMGMLLGGTFFAGHTATLDYRLEDLLSQMGRWWVPAWGSVIALPLCWYLLMLWYAGFWDDRKAHLYQRQRGWFGLVCILGALLMIVLLVVNPFRLLQQMTHFDGTITLRALPWLFACYPPYLLACSLLSIDALRRPGPSGRMMGDLARRRARPWLIAASLVLFGVSLLVAMVLGRVVALVLKEQVEKVVNEIMLVASVVDLLATALISLAIVLLGKAIVSYEIFTGQTLPRQGFLKQWRQFVILAATYSSLVSLAWAMPLRPVYPLLLTSVLLAASYALFAWRGFVEREAAIESLRPFLRSQHLYDSLLSDSDSDGDGVMDSIVPQRAAQEQFRALCDTVLDASVGFLVPLGSAAALVGDSLSFPSDRNAPNVGDLPTKLNAKDVCLAIDDAQFGGASWAVPLWSARGLSGILLLGEKSNGGLYSQEEIEIAQSGGERLIDARAGSEVTSRLMSLQRGRLAQSRLIDNRTRRTLHDDILPQLHAAMLSLSALSTSASTCTSQNSSNAHAASSASTCTSQNAHNEALEQLADVHRQISNLLREMPLSTTPEWARKGLIGALRDCVQFEFSGHFDNVIWDISPATQSAAALPALTGEVLFHATREAIRNAARYARIPNKALNLTIGISALPHWTITIEDDGGGLENSGEREDGGGAGQGLSLHTTMLAIAGGTLSLENAPNGGTRVVIALAPNALSLLE